MKPFLFIILFFLYAMPVQAADFAYGLRAYNANEFEIARQTWLPLALQDNHMQAQYYLGQIYSAGVGVPLDNVQAMIWYKMAAVQGYAKAQARLACLYERGLGAPVDHKKAHSWYLKAAKQGDLYSQHKLGFLYAEGRGVKKSPAEAYKWWGVAALWGDPDAPEDRDRIADKLTKEEQARLDKIIDAWRLEKTSTK